MACKGLGFRAHERHAVLVDPVEETIESGPKSREVLNESVLRLTFNIAAPLSSPCSKLPSKENVFNVGVPELLLEGLSIELG